jgi:hypothetical protein
MVKVKTYNLLFQSNYSIVSYAALIICVYIGRPLIDTRKINHKSDDVTL